MACSRVGIGSIPSDSILALDSAEYFGRRAAVRNSRSLVGFSGGLSPAAAKIFAAQSNHRNVQQGTVQQGTVQQGPNIQAGWRDRQTADRSGDVNR